MPIPYIFSPGEIAASSEVNENFRWLTNIVGVNSSETRMNPLSDIILGPRQNMQICALSDTSPSERTSFLHMGWNSEYYLEGNTWKFKRFNDGEKAYSFRIGAGGVGIYASSRTTGNLDSQNTLMFNVGATMSNKDRDWVYVRDSFTNVNKTPTEHGQVRSTFVPLTEPIQIYASANIGTTTLHRNVVNMGIPEYAVAVYLSFQGKVGSKDSDILFTRTMNTLYRKYGFRVSQKANSLASGAGIVTLGMSGSHAGKFSEYRAGSWTSASLFIQGYYI